MIVLGIETSCDETAAAVINGDGKMLSNVVLSQIESHRPYGGIVPEVAARAHMETTDEVVKRAMIEADIGFDQLDAVAATGGPGLIGGVIVGVMTAKAIAFAHNIPFIAVNHLEGHALTPRLTDGAEKVAFPYLLLLVSGGHCQLQVVSGVGKYTRLGTTIDDALGEAFDKTAKVMGLGYPGGPAIELAATKGDKKRFDLPRPMKGRDGCDFSFSGLKAAVKRGVDALPPGELKEQDVADMAASFQQAASECVIDRTKNAISMFKQSHPDGANLVIAGGVAANKALRKGLEKLASENQMALMAPPPALCTDNAAMIAWAGIEKLKTSPDNWPGDGLDFAPRPRWALDPNAARAVGAGVKA